MKLVNETNQAVSYWITCGNSADCGTIEVDGYVRLPGYDNQTNVEVRFEPAQSNYFSATLSNTGTDRQVEMAVIVEAGQD